jgi:hypothetical protein
VLGGKNGIVSGRFERAPLPQNYVLLNKPFLYKEVIECSFFLWVFHK